MRRRSATVATPGEWQCKIRTGGVRRLAVANGPNIFQMLLVIFYVFSVKFRTRWLGLSVPNSSGGKEGCGYPVRSTAV